MASPKQIKSFVVFTAVAIYLAFGVRNIIAIGQHFYRQYYELPRFAEEMARTKLGHASLTRLLRSENAYGHARDAQVLECGFTPSPPYAPPRWDYICFLYWGTQPGVEQSVQQMKFGAMVDSTRVTQLSDLVPANGPNPPLNGARSPR